MATVVLLFALVQVITALRMWDKISWPGRVPPWFGQVHRVSGTLAFLEYPNVDDQLAIVANGRDGMPVFGQRLTPDELMAVVEFTRTRLGA